MITLSSVTLSRGPRTLLENVNATLFAGWRVGVVGRNGTGKSSLFALLLGEFGPDRGDVFVPKNLEIASVAQEVEPSPKSALDFVLDGDVELRRTEAALVEAEITHDAHQIAALHERLYAIDGYAAAARAARLLHGLGFSPEQHEQPVASFSGGWRMRLNLGRALMCRSNLLLLDEPTNHLDLDAVLWLQEWLRAYEGTMLVISHDREFLDAVTTHTFHLSGNTTTLYTGNYSEFERMRAERQAQQTALAAQQARQVAHLQSFVDRFRAKASKARQAQSRIKMIERIKLVAPALADSEFSFNFPPPAKLPAPLVAMNDAAVGYDTERGYRQILGGIKFAISPGDRVGLLGPNGAGKTTFIRLLAGELGARDGAMTRHPDLNVGYFAQHQLEQLDPKATPLEHFRRLDPSASELSLRTMLGTFNFRGDRVFEPVAPFSGGEKARLALALVVYRRPNLLLLDEPTNHLDLDMRQALEMALQDFDGAVVLVSHDRHLIGSTSDTLWRVSDGAVAPFDGDLDDYARWLAQRERRQGKGEPVAKPVMVEAPKPAPSAEQRKSSADRRLREKPLRDEVKKSEREMEKLQARLVELEKALVDPANFEPAQRTKLAALQKEQAEGRAALAVVEERWLAASAELEAL